MTFVHLLFVLLYKVHLYIYVVIFVYDSDVNATYASGNKCISPK